MIHKSHIYLLLLLTVSCGQLPAQSIIDRVSYPLSPSETSWHDGIADIRQKSSNTLYANPVYTQWMCHNDTTLRRRSAIVYASLSGADSKGDFIPYEGNGSTDYRIGAYGEYTTPHSGTFSGSIQYAQGKHRKIGWSAMRLPELYLPYISTDSCGGDFKFDTYFAEASYAFTFHQLTLGVRGSFYGEQAYRLTDPRALNNTTWLRFNVGAAHQIGHHLFMLDAGYGRNKQHMQLRYWRPGQQDRFFVCYGFGFYDTRQSAVSFGKSRMYYINEYNARLQYLSPQDCHLRIHASLNYVFSHMKTEESDIYNLYESRSHQINPIIRLTYAPQGPWKFEMMIDGAIEMRKGYENIIEEYLIDKENNIYDFRTIDTRQNYTRNTGHATAALQVAHQAGSIEMSLQGGITADAYEEKYKTNSYLVKLNTLTPHAKMGVHWQGQRDDIVVSLLYARRTVGTHRYDVQMQNQKIPHLDFQHAFAPYAFRCADLNKVVAGITWQHQLKKIAIGLDAKLYLANGHRHNDAIFTGSIGFPSKAPMLSPTPDKHKERWCYISTFITF